ncbi:MAG TPA: phosphoglycerate dehydrogenase [Solirubrobacterales bacterium]|jgi:phosphoglycerate dehydrogenase-like enzyme
MEGRVVVTYGGFALDHPEAGGALRAAGLELVVSPRGADRTPEQLAEVLGDAVAAIADADPFDAGVLERATGLRVIARTGVGLDSIDLAAASRHGVVVTTTPGTNHETVADHTLALMLAALRNLGRLDGSVRAGGWRDFSLPMSQLHGSTVGLVGYGAIGGAVGRRVEAFGATLLVHDPLGAADGELVDLDELLERSDVISLHLPLTPETTDLIDARRIALMRPGAILVNTSRGPIVDQDALVEALREGRLGGAGLDVFAVEPPGQGPLRELPNVVMSPHCGGISAESNLAMSKMATVSVLAALAGAPSGAIANPDVLAAPR